MAEYWPQINPVVLEALVTETNARRAELAEVEAVAHRLQERAQTAEARLAAVEAERDRRHEYWLAEAARRYKAEDKLAAVRALCVALAGDIERSRVHGDGPPEYRAGWQHGVEFAAEQVRAVLAAVDGGPADHIALFDGPTP